MNEIEKMEQWAEELCKLAALFEEIAANGCDRRTAVAALGTARMKLAKAPSALPERYRAFAKAWMHEFDAKILRMQAKADVIPFNRKGNGK